MQLLIICKNFKFSIKTLYFIEKKLISVEKNKWQYMYIYVQYMYIYVIYNLYNIYIIKIFIDVFSNSKIPEKPIAQKRST